MPNTQNSCTRHSLLILLIMCATSIISCDSHNTTSTPTIKTVDVVGIWIGKLESNASKQDLDRIESASHTITFKNDREFIAQGLLSLKVRSGFDAIGQWVISQDGTYLQLVCDNQTLQKYDPETTLRVESNNSGDIILRYGWDDPDMYNDILFFKGRSTASREK